MLPDNNYQFSQKDVTGFQKLLLFLDQPGIARKKPCKLKLGTIHTVVWSVLRSIGKTPNHDYVTHGSLRNSPFHQGLLLWNDSVVFI